MFVRRLIVGLVVIFLWVAHDSDMASGQSPELREAFTTYSTLYEQGRYAEAELLYWEALAIVETNLGPDHLSVAGHLDALAQVFRAQGRETEAEDFRSRAQAIRSKDVASSASAQRLDDRAQAVSLGLLAIERSPPPRLPGLGQPTGGSNTDSW